MFTRTPNGKESKLGEVPLLDHFNGSEFVELRSALSQGIKHPGCNRCWKEEEAGRDSKRIRDNSNWSRDQQGLVYVELNMGNTCNIKCRTCAPHSSSQWAQELYDTKYVNVVSKEEYRKKIRTYSNSYDDDSTFWKELEDSLSTIKKIDFYGGEPLLSKKMWSVLKRTVELGYAKDMTLNYATNGTVWPVETEVWKHFKQVNLGFSIDGVGSRFEYMRHPAVWNDVLVNMSRPEVTYSNMRPFWCVTLSALNIFYLDEIINYFNARFRGSLTLYLNLVHWPEHFNISGMPDNVKKIVIDKLNTIPKSHSNQLSGIIKFIENGTPNTEQWDTLMNEIRLTDNYRNEDYATTFPEFAKIIGYTK
jgi:sulfatase maturation enzyme AslB (radical SAM superfamily)